MKNIEDCGKPYSDDCYCEACSLSRAISVGEAHQREADERAYVRDSILRDSCETPHELHVRGFCVRNCPACRALAATEEK